MPAARAFSIEGCKRVEVHRRQNDGCGLQQDRVVHLALLQIGLVVGIERDDLIAHILQELLDGADRFGLELVQQRGHHVVDLALGLGEGGRNQRDGGERQHASYGSE